MSFVAFFLIGLGFIMGLVGGIWLLVLAFQESIWWGLGSLFVPFVSLVFAIMFWSIARKPFLISLAGTALAIIGAVILAMSSGVPSQLPS